MNTNSKSLNTKLSVCIAAVAACAALSAPIQAQGGEVTIKIPVVSQDLDLNQPAGARAMYQRLHSAARIACTHGNRVDLAPATSYVACYEQALAGAVRSFNRPQLTAVYLQAHTLQDAVARGVAVPTLAAAK